MSVRIGFTSILNSFRWVWLLLLLGGKQASRVQIGKCTSNIDNEIEAVEELGTSLWKELHPKNNFDMLSHVQHTRHFAGIKKIDIHDQLIERYACHRKYAP